MKECKNPKCSCSGDCVKCKYKDKSKGQGKLIKTISSAAIFFLAFLCDFSFGANVNSGKPGLLVITHGAPWSQWNQPVLDLEKAVVKELGGDNPFGKVKFVFMEFAEPTVADGVKELEDAGCSRIIAVPLLIAPSTHSHWDIPALLGIYSDTEMEKQLKEEGAKIIRSKLPITLTPTLADSGVIEEIMLKRVKELSTQPDNEAVILLAHGDYITGSLWDDFLKKTTIYICGKTGISYGNWAFVEMGQDYDKAVSAISLAGGSRKKIIVVGAYLSMGIDGLHSRWLAQSKSMSDSMPHPVPESAIPESDPFEGLEIILGKKGLLPDSMVGKWIAEVARKEALKN